jgi:phosphotransferase system  glucose/maltose/N-acetylglucosamine-specific IIC component
LIILATLPILAILNGFGNMDEQKLFNFFWLNSFDEKIN